MHVYVSFKLFANVAACIQLVDIQKALQGKTAARQARKLPLLQPYYTMR